MILWFHDSFSFICNLRVFNYLKAVLSSVFSLQLSETGFASPRFFASSSRTPPMPICIECRYPVHQLYTTYSKADDRSLGKGVRLTQCPRCKRFADKYVEHDFVVLFIDLVLIKPQVYRHLLFNRLGHEDDRFDVRLSSVSVIIFWCWQNQVVYCASRRSPPAIRCLPYVGTHRKGRRSQGFCDSCPSTIYTARDSYTWRSHRRIARSSHKAIYYTTIPLLRCPLFPRNPRVPLTNTAYNIARALLISLSIPEPRLDCSVGLKLYETVSHTHGHLGLRSSIFSIGG